MHAPRVWMLLMGLPTTLLHCTAWCGLLFVAFSLDRVTRPPCTLLSLTFLGAQLQETLCLAARVHSAHPPIGPTTSL